MPKHALFHHPLAAVSLAIAFALGVSTACAAPPDNKPKAGKPSSASQARDGFDVDVSGGVSIGISFGDARRLATQYGLTGSKPLPPGIVKNLARGKPLPPGIQKTRMPDAFIGQLPHHPGYEWRQAGPDLVLVASGTLVISDILQGVFD